MRKLLIGVATLTVAAALGSCAKADPTPTTSTSVASSTTATSPAQTTSTTPEATTTSTTPAGSTTVDQSTPEAALVSLIDGMAAGDARTVCGLMSAGGIVIGENETALKACADTVAPSMEQLKGMSGVLSGLKVSGATITGSKATFTAANVVPSTLAPMVKAFKAQKINGKWYITQ